MDRSEAIEAGAAGDRTPRDERDDRLDESLVRAVLDGDQRAFEHLLRRHESRVLRVLGLLGIARDDRDDVAQEVFVRVFRFLRGYRPGRPFSGWVYRIAVNAAHDHRARLGRRRRDEVAWAPSLDERVADRGQSADRPHRTLDLRQRLEAALETLSERERAVFVLKELEGFDTRDVARSLGITSITVRRHLGRARRSLQRTLEAQGSPGTAVPREKNRSR